LKSIKIISKVKDGKLILNTERIATALRQFEGKRVELVLRKDNYYRSNQQNAYYFAVIIKIPKSTTQNTTIEQEDFHNQCRQFLREWFNVEAPLPNEEIIFE